MKILITEEQFSKIKSSKKKYYIGDSKIHGKGTFASKDLEEGEEIGEAHTIHKLHSDYDFTELGKFHNHSDKPNSHNVLKKNKRFLVASKPIKKGEEITTNYRLQPDLEQPGQNFDNLTEEKKIEDMKPHIDGYRTYSPFKDLDYIIVNGNGIDCDNIVWDLVLLGDNGTVKFCKKNSGSHFLKGAKMVVELPLKNNEDPKSLFNNKKTIKRWILNKVNSIDKNFEIRKKFYA